MCVIELSSADRKQLHSLLEDATKDSLLLLQVLLKEGKYLVLWPVEEPEFPPVGPPTGIKVISTPILSPEYDINEKLAEVASVKILCEFVVKTSLSEQIVIKGITNPPTEQILLFLFRPFLLHIVACRNDLAFNQELFQNTYEELLGYFESPTVVFSYIVPLLGFDAQTEDRIDLATNLFIERISTRLKIQLWQDAAISHSWGQGDIAFLKYQATFTEIVSKDNLTSNAIFPRRIEELQCLLRFAKKEAISILTVILNISPWYQKPFGRPTGYLLWPTANPLIGRYIDGGFQSMVLAPPFAADEIARLKLFWKNFSDMPNSGDKSRLELALRRFNSVYDRFTQEDRILDYWIALEILYPTSGRGFSQKRLATISDFLGYEGYRRKQFNKSLQDSYTLRSDIVHGRPYSQNLNEMIPVTEKALTSSIVRCLELKELPS